MTEQKCELCGEPMPPGEEMFKIHGYSGDCPKPPLPKARPAWIDAAAKECAARVNEVEEAVLRLNAWIRDYGDTTTRPFARDLRIIVEYAKAKLREDWEIERGERAKTK